MDKETIAKLKGEAASLRQRLAAIDSLLALYTGKPSPPSTEQGVKRTYQRNSGISGKVLEICRPIIHASGASPVSTRHLLDIVVDQGLAIGGQNALATLSAIISNSGEFKNVDRQGWIKKDAAQEAVDDSGEEIPF